MDIDRTLSLLGAMPVPELDGLDGARLAALARDEQRQLRTATSAAMFVALFVGLAGGIFPSDDAQASVVPFGPPMELTPLVQLARG